MNTQDLYFGIQIDPLWWSEWLLIPEEKRSFFLKETQLEEIEQEGMRYWGKRCGTLLLFEQLHLLKVHILSILCKFLPHFNIDNQLFTLLLIEKTCQKKNLTSF